jgi:hypothetical protein
MKNIKQLLAELSAISGNIPEKSLQQRQELGEPTEDVDNVTSPYRMPMEPMGEVTSPEMKLPEVERLRLLQKANDEGNTQEIVDLRRIKRDEINKILNMVKK